MGVTSAMFDALGGLLLGGAHDRLEIPGVVTAQVRRGAACFLLRHSDLRGSLPTISLDWLEEYPLGSGATVA